MWYYTWLHGGGACIDNISVHGGGACADNICVNGGACVPLIYDYYNVLYGAILRFCVQNRCYLY